MTRGHVMGQPLRRYFRPKVVSGVDCTSVQYCTHTVHMISPQGVWVHGCDTHLSGRGEEIKTRSDHRNYPPPSLSSVVWVFLSMRLIKTGRCHDSWGRCREPFPPVAACPVRSSEAPPSSPHFFRHWTEEGREFNDCSDTT